MARQLSFSGTDSKVDGCPALHTDEGTGEIIVQGTPVTNPEDLAQLQHYGPDDAAVAVPRELLVNWGPKEMDRVPEMVDRDTFRRLFTTFEHTAWRLETRRGYASDRQDPDFQAFLALRPRGALVPQHQDPDGRRQDGRPSPHRRQPAHHRAAVPARLRPAQHGGRRGHPLPVARGRRPGDPARRGLLDLRFTDRGVAALRRRRHHARHRVDHRTGPGRALRHHPRRGHAPCRSVRPVRGAGGRDRIACVTGEHRLPAGTGSSGGAAA